MSRAYKFRAYPTRPQEGRSGALLRDHCDLYNAALEERREAWRKRKVPVSYGTQSAQLKEIRRADPDGQGRHSFTAQQQTLRRLGTVFQGFFNRVKAGAKERAQAGSGNRKRLRRALAKEWRKTRNRRLDFHHKIARKLVSECDVIALEDLNTAGMTRRPAPKPDPGQLGAYLPNGSAAKAGLNKAILDAGWAQFAVILKAKAEDAGRRVILVNPAYTSITCHQCGARCERPQQDTVLCPACGPHDADVNGARNIYARAGLGSGQTATAA